MPSSAATSLADLPILPSDPANIHDAYLAARKLSPLARDYSGAIVALHARHKEALFAPSLTRQLELEVLEMQGVTEGPIFENTVNMLLWSNGSAHKRRRGALTRTFAFKLMEGMRPKVRMIAESLIRNRLGAGPIDFLEEIAGQIPALIIAEILGLPKQDIPDFLSMVEATGKTTFVFPAEERQYIEKRMLDFFAYTDALIEERRKYPRGDFLSEFVDQSGRDDGLSDAELRANLIGLIIAGSDTTKNSIAMTFSLLLDHREQWRMVVQDPEAMKRPAALEGQRFEPIALLIPRMATAAFELDGFAIAPGTLLYFSILAACRDPEVFQDPDRFDIMRSDHPRMALGFGAGAHRCLGETLAWIEIEETIAALASLAPGSVRTGPPTQLGLQGSRIADQLEVRLEAPR